MTEPSPQPAFRFWDSGPALLLLGTLFWGSNFVLGRALRDDIPAIAFAFWRWTIACAVALPLAWKHLRKDAPILLAHWRLVTALAVLGVSIFNTCVYIGLHYTAATNGALLQSTLPLCIIVVAFVLFRDRLPAAKVGAVLLSFAGAAVIAARGSLGSLLALDVNPGDAIIFGAVVCYAFYSVLLRRRPSVHPLSLLAATIGIGATLLLPVYAAELAWTGGFRPELRTTAALVYVGIFPSVLSYLFFNRAVEVIGAARAGHFAHLIPVYASILAALLLGERLHTYHLMGAALIAAGIVLANLRARRRPQPNADIPVVGTT